MKAIFREEYYPSEVECTSASFVASTNDYDSSNPRAYAILALIGVKNPEEVKKELLENRAKHLKTLDGDPKMVQIQTEEKIMIILLQPGKMGVLKPSCITIES